MPDSHFSKFDTPSVGWQEANKIGENQPMMRFVSRWGYLSQRLWDSIGDGNSHIRELIGNNLGLSPDPEGFQGFLKQLHYDALSSIAPGKNGPETAARELEKLAAKPGLNQQGKLVNTPYEERPLTYAVNNAAKDVALMSLGVNLMEGNFDGRTVIAKDGSRAEVTSFQDIPEELADPHHWQLRFNLKDRGWIMIAGNKKYFLRERKSPQHFDHIEGKPRDSYSQPVKEEAALADRFEDVYFEQQNLKITAETPIAAIKMFNSNNESGFEFAIYEYEDKMDVPSIDDHQNHAFKERLAKEYEKELKGSQEYKDYVALVNKRIPIWGGLNRAISVNQYAQLKAEIMERMIDPYMRFALANSGMANGDAVDGYGLRKTKDGTREMVIFDFEKVVPIERFVREDLHQHYIEKTKEEFDFIADTTELHRKCQTGTITLEQLAEDFNNLFKEYISPDKDSRVAMSLRYGIGHSRVTSRLFFDLQQISEAKQQGRKPKNPLTNVHYSQLIAALEIFSRLQIVPDNFKMPFLDELT